MRPTSRAKALRRPTTEAERVLWRHLRDGLHDGLRLGCWFRRHYAIGRYVADFICLERRLIIEVDSPRHSALWGSPAVRDARLAARGYRVLRLSGAEVLQQPEAAMEAVRVVLAAADPDPAAPTAAAGKAEAPSDG